ncbi:MAG: cyclic nucleotide-binding domain-containing protein [Acidobacteriaceae bacterium]|nr:cyclic nucleotide-binding domain-containing protein [Acidobacteriaceae bacterium]
MLAQLGAQAARDLSKVFTPDTLPEGSLLFREGEESTGVFILCRGAARIYVGDPNQASLTLHTSGAGETLGLSAVLAEHPYEVSAELTTRSRLMFIPARDFRRWLQKNPEGSMRVVQFLSEQVHAAYERVRSFQTRRSYERTN